MGSYLKRMIDVSQRIIPFDGGFLAGPLKLGLLEFHIQGVRFQLNGSEYNCPFHQMAECGVLRWRQRKLSVVDRLRRKLAPIGSFQQPDPERLLVSLWSEPELIFELNLGDEYILNQWKEALTIVKAAGFQLNAEF